MATKKTSEKGKKPSGAKPARAKKAVQKQPMKLPPFGKLSSRALLTLAGKIDKTHDSLRIKEYLEKAVGEDWSSRYRLLWYLTEHRLLVEKNRGVLDLLAENPDDASPEVLIDFLARLPPAKAFGKEEPILLLEDYPA